MYTFYSDIQGGWSGIGNINADPLFVDTANGDYRLQGGSPCIDAGIQDTMIIYNNGQDTLVVPPIPYLGLAPDMGAYEFDPSTGIAEKTDIPIRYTLYQNYPNPFNPSTSIEFALPKTSHVTLKIFNILGEEVATLVSDRLTSGTYSYEWNASNMASGIYLYRLHAGSLTTKSGHYAVGEAGDFVEIKKMILMK